MKNQKSQKSTRTLKTGEKFLLGASLFAIISLIVFGFVQSRQPHYEARIATPEAAAKSIVIALTGQNDLQIKSLSTPKGYASLQTLMKTTSLNSYSLLGNRISTEWGNDSYWENFDDSRTQESWGLSKDVKPGEEKPLLSFRRTPKGWKLDDYIPQSSRLFKRGSHAGKVWNVNE